VRKCSSKIKIIAVGLLKNGFNFDCYYHYSKMMTMRPHLIECSFSFQILKNIAISDYVILLDEKGKNLTSVQFSEFLFLILQSQKTVTFVVGAHDGVPDCIKKRADFFLSLSSLTFPHLMARSLLIEQLYRAFQIQHNSPYHRE
jgi:23S rRNA (pseudouridine1915-N3)-methyltransferase